ncbi:hypothetical protein ACIQNI_08705 [Streptomyces sp. NPDC091266]|uniref:hypothetical protein n=1 Tax=Streptomyces sp. NPDC091266 TaxID=3365978 RepID=UPI003823CC2B
MEPIEGLAETDRQGKKGQAMSGPRLVRAPLPSTNSTARVKDDEEVIAQRARKAALLERMRARLNGKQPTSREQLPTSIT